jgi:ABC-type multidrug transport system ATPase subunit
VLLTGAENMHILRRLRGLTRRAARSRPAELLDRFALALAGAQLLFAQRTGDH